MGTSWRILWHRKAASSSNSSPEEILWRPRKLKRACALVYLWARKSGIASWMRLSALDTIQAMAALSSRLMARVTMLPSTRMES
jgi:hypothetical protein